MNYNFSSMEELHDLLSIKGQILRSDQMFVNFHGKGDGHKFAFFKGGLSFRAKNFRGGCHNQDCQKSKIFTIPPLIITERSLIRLFNDWDGLWASINIIKSSTCIQNKIMENYNKSNPGNRSFIIHGMGAVPRGGGNKI